MTEAEVKLHWRELLSDPPENLQFCILCCAPASTIVLFEPFEKNKARIRTPEGKRRLLFYGICADCKDKYTEIEAALFNWFEMMN